MATSPDCPFCAEEERERRRRAHRAKRHPPNSETFDAEIPVELVLRMNAVAAKHGTTLARVAGAVLEERLQQDTTRRWRAVGEDLSLSASSVRANATRHGKLPKIPRRRIPVAASITAGAAVRAIAKRDKMPVRTVVARVLMDWRPPEGDRALRPAQTPG